MTEQITNQIMMIRPIAFHMNEQTVANNYYQHDAEGMSEGQVQKKALTQFDAMVERLREEGVQVIVFDDTNSADTPDSIFPNNWISFHDDGRVRLYPMFAPNRRSERRADILEGIAQEFFVSDHVSFADWEEKNAFLEGTGSLVLDRQHKIAYAAISARTMMDPLEDFCKEAAYEAVTFHANQSVDGRRLPIYHTNVMMCVGEKFAVVCLDSIDDEQEKSVLKNSLEKTGKEIIAITEYQVEHFAGNMLQVVGKEEQRLIVMSSAAFHSLDHSQVDRLSDHGKIVHCDVHTIEWLGGGSARCMMAEIFLPKKQMSLNA